MANLARNLVRTCLRITADDKVTVWYYPHAQDLAEGLAVECAKVGADVLLAVYTDRYYETFVRNMPVETLREPSAWCRGLTEIATAQFWLGGPYDPAIFRRMPPEKKAASDAGETAAHWPLTAERKIRSLSMDVGFVTRPRAEAYGFSFPAWARTVREASAVPPAKLTQEGRRLAKVLESADRVRVTGKDTDLAFSVLGRKARVHDGVVDDEDIAAGAYSASIPAGSVVIPAVETSARGRFVSTVPQPWSGRLIRRMEWTFEDGRATSFGGDAGARAMRKEWELATGDRDRIAALCLGLNPKAKLGFIHNSIARGAVSISIGMSEPIGGRNVSSFYAEHTLPNATVEVDGRPVVRKGRILV